jgi:hypothetical protein
MNDGLAVAIIGGLAGSALTFAWELFLKPLMAGRMLAEVIAADLSLQLQAIAANLAQVRANPRTIPHRKPVPTVVYAAIASRLGELPRDVVGETILMYRSFERLNEVAELAASIFEQMEVAEERADQTQLAVLTRRLHREVAQYHAMLEGSLARMNELQPKMVAHAMPWWSLRFWRARKAENLPLKTVTDMVEKRQADLEQRQATLRDLNRIDG